MEIIKNDSGMTMIELLIAFVIFGILVVAVTPVFKQGSDSWQDTKAEVELRQNLNSALQLMSRELRQAKASTVNVGTGDEIVRYKYDYDTSGPHNSFKWLGSGGRKYIDFSSESESKHVTVPDLINITDARVILVSSDPPVYKIRISGEYTKGNRTESHTVETTVVIRSSSNLEEWQEDI